MAREAPADAFGRTAQEYELGRPGWPEELVERISGELGLGSDAVVLDLGAGTGKLSRSLVLRFARVFAVEPDEAMRAVLEQVVPGAEALAGAAEAIPLEDASVDAVYSAEAFHWFSTKRALAEIARVLRPRGGLGLFWNIPSGELEPPLGEEAEALIDEAFRRGGAPGLPRVLSGAWRAPFAGAGFEELREHELERELVSDREAWLANLLSVSSIAVQPEEERAAFARKLRELVPPGEYRRHLRTVAYWTRLAG
ncbi:MAG TPA: class I SAM-dependent methyltransferase [Gaiellaceae bacterium]